MIDHIERLSRTSFFADAAPDQLQAVADAGRTAARTAAGIAGAIPTIAKAVAVAAAGLGVYAIVKR